MSSPSPRWFHASALLGNAIYFTGGTTKDGSGKNQILDETLALDISRSWTIDHPAFTTLTRMPTPLSGHSLSKIPDSTRLLVAGGESGSASAYLPIQLFETAGGSWSAPKLSKNDTVAFHRLYHATVTTGKDGALLHGGYLTSSANGTVVSTLITLKASNDFKPTTSTPVALAKNAPALARHTMTLTSNGFALILGGVDSKGTAVGLNQAHVLDTQAGNTEWKVQTLTGTPPEPRMAFSAVMINVTTLVVFGGTADYRSAFTQPFYLDLPTWTWSSPEAQGEAPNRWGHTATMVGSSMVVAFGTSSTPDSTQVALLDTTTNTWTKTFRPVGMINPEKPEDAKKLSVAAVLGITFVITVAIVGGLFYLLVRRRKRRTRNTLARENLADHTPRAAIRKQASNERFGVFTGAATFLGIGGAGAGKNGSSKRYSDMSMHTHPMAITNRMAQLGYSPLSLGYPEIVVQHGTGTVPVASYIYPKQACVETEREQDGQETIIVYHTMTQAQQEALMLSKQSSPKSMKTASKLW